MSSIIYIKIYIFLQRTISYEENCKILQIVRWSPTLFFSSSLTYLSWCFAFFVVKTHRILCNMLLPYEILFIPYEIFHCLFNCTVILLLFFINILINNGCSCNFISKHIKHFFPKNMILKIRILCFFVG